MSIRQAFKLVVLNQFEFNLRKHSGTFKYYKHAYFCLFPLLIIEMNTILNKYLATVEQETILSDEMQTRRVY